MHKNLLALETSCSELSIALQKEGGEILESSIPGHLNHVENLLPEIDRLLRQNRLTLHEIDAFLIDRGPGSFTGLRVGFATLKAFCLAQKKDCFGAYSLDMIAEGIDLEERSQLAVLVDAFRNKLYAKLFERYDGMWKSQDRIELLSLPELLSKLPGEIYLTGDALIRYQKEFQTGVKDGRFHFLPASEWHPKASTLISLFRNRNAKISKFQAPSDFVPFYFRLSEAEEKQNTPPSSRTE